MNTTIKTLLICATLLLVTSQVFAIPQFAKKYGVSCITCHAAVPKLNAFGEAFRRNGFQIPGSTDPVPVWQQDLLPLSGMPHPMYMTRNIKNNMLIPTTTNIPAGETLEINTFRGAFEFFSGGTAGDHLSYLAFIEIEIEPELAGAHEEEESTDGHEEEPAPEIETHTEIEFHQFFLAYNNLINITGENTGEVNLRIGYFHLETPYVSLRKLSSEMSPYLVYSIQPVKGGFNLARRQVGVSAYGGIGSIRKRFDYEIALVNGTNDLIDTNTEKDLFFRGGLSLHERLKIGALYYTGEQNISGGSNLNSKNDKFRRFGLDLSVNLPRGANIFGQWLKGHDDDTDGVMHGEQPFEFSGGFVEADVPLRVFSMENRFLRKIWLIGKYDFINVDKQVELEDADMNMMFEKNIGNEKSINMYSLGLRYYFQPNVFMLLEAGIQDNMIGYPPLDVLTGGEASGSAGRVLNVDADWFMAMFVLAF